MKKYSVLTLALILTLGLWAQKPANTKPVPGPVVPTDITWVSVNELPALLEKEPRKVFIDVYTSWCGPCKMMMNSTFKDPEIIEYVNKHYYAVKFNAEGNEVVNFKGYQFINSAYDASRANSRNETHDFTLAIAPVQTRIAYPTLVYFDENLNILAPIQGYYQAQQLKPILSYFHENKFKEIDLQSYMNANSQQK